VILCVSLAFAAQPAHPEAPPAGETRIVKGTVTLPEGAGPPSNAVVYIEGSVGKPAPRAASIDQKDLEFIPHVVAVPVGSTVIFLNSEPVLHNVFSSSIAKRFDLGMFGLNEKRAVTVDQPGVIDVRCKVHPNMEAYIVVLENDFFAIPDAQGNFQIGGLPPGRYRLRVWHEALPALETWVNLEEAKIRVLELRLHR